MFKKNGHFFKAIDYGFCSPSLIPSPRSWRFGVFACGKKTDIIENAVKIINFSS